jgi:hypothetical protein
VGPRAGLDYEEKRKFLTLPGLELQPVASRYTDYATLAPTRNLMLVVFTKTLPRQRMTYCSLIFIVRYLIK